jgi:mannitol-1-phosphate 5-dehydrogenase
MAGKRFVGFGFGPIQSGLMLLEAQASGNFDAYCIVEIDEVIVETIRRARGQVAVNVARRAGVSHHVLEGFTILNPREEADRGQIVELVRAADELATAIPSVDFYAAGGPASIASILAEGADASRRRILYACENNNYAAELLTERVAEARGADTVEGLTVLNTVIGKMSGAVEAADIPRLGLRPVVPGADRAVLVEEFNRILISRCPEGVQRGISVFEEREDLLPFEEAKLYGHNAIHALLGYLAAGEEYEVMSRLRENGALMDLGLRAFTEESGAAMIYRHAGCGELFTAEGYRRYAEDLLERMTNPYLYDAVSRICRDPARKLGKEDRIFGTMRRAFEAGAEPRLMALGAAAGVRYARKIGEPWVSEQQEPSASLQLLWGDEPDALAMRCLDLVDEAEDRLSKGGAW